MNFIKIEDLYFLFVISLIKVVSWSYPAKLKEFIVNSIALAAYQFSKNKRRLSEKKLFEVFGEKLSENQRREIVKGVFYEFCKETFCLLPSRVERAALKNVRLCGMEHLHLALKAGRGVILWESSSFGQRNLAKQILYENGFPLHQVHAETHLGGFLHDNSSPTWVRRQIIKPFFEKCERKFVAEIIPLPNSDSLAFTRHLLNRLKQNGIVCITGDVKYGQKLISLKFLGSTKLFSPGMVSLAKISGASILTMFCIQEKKGKTTLIIEPPIHIETGLDRERGLEKGLTQYVNLLELYIKRYPEKYRSWRYLGKFGKD